MAWLSGYKYRKAFTIDKTKIGSGTHSLFTAYVPIANDAGFGAHAKADGTDVCWTKADGTTLLNFQRRAFAVDEGLATGSWEVLLADDISSAANPLVYAYYGDADAADLSDADGAWNSNVVGAWYLGEAITGAAGELKDASASANHGTPTATLDSVVGKIGNCIDVTAAGEMVNCGSGASLDNIRTLTLECWAYIDTSGVGQGYGTIACKGFLTGWFLGCNASATNLRFFVRRATTAGLWTFNVASGAWQHIALTYDFSSVDNDPAVFVNGSAVSVTEALTPVGDPKDDSAESFYLGNSDDAARTFDGKIEEVRVHNVIRSAGWLLTRYNNESSPGTFVTAGAEEAFVRIPQYYHRMKVR